MDRAASMCSMFYHIGKRRSQGLQRVGSNWDIIISIRTSEITQYVSLDDMFVDSGNVSIQVPVPRYAFDRLVQPGSAESGAGATPLMMASYGSTPVGPVRPWRVLSPRPRTQLASSPPCRPMSRTRNL